MNKAKLASIVLAAGAAAAFAVAPAVSSAKHGGKHHEHCMGVNACKGMSSCKGSENSCKGQNSCKGKGWVDLNKHQCKQIGGTWGEEGGEKEGSK